MRIVHLPLFWTIVLDSVSWAVIQPAIAYLSFRFPPSLLDLNRWLYGTRPWERQGAIYHDLLRVRLWKSWLPSGGTLFEAGFPMDRVRSRQPGYLAAWLTETCRAELCHWIAILPSILFFLWNPPWLAIVMVVYALLFNAIPIVVQRHNRPRLLALLGRAQARAGNA